MKVLATGDTKSVKLDQYDKKILYSLSQNARTPYSQIAKFVGLSRDSIRYRIKRLTDAGVIQGYRAIVNVQRLGFLNVHLFLQLNQPTPEAESVLVKNFTSYPFVRAILKFNGKYDFELALIAKDMNHLEEVISTVVGDCGDYLRDYHLLFVTKGFVGKTFPDNFLPQDGLEQKKGDSKLTEAKLDETDFKLLKAISNHADMSLHKLSQQLSVSADTITYRLKKLKQSGVLVGFVPVINYHVINYNVYAILLSISGFDKKKEATLQQFLKTNKDILWGVKTIGKYNVLLYVCTTDPNDLIRSMSELRSYFTESVRDYETLINFEEYKYTYFPDIIIKEDKNNVK